MYAIQQLAEDLYQIALPAPAGLPLPWGAPRNAVLLLGDEPALVDTCHEGSADALCAALATLGLTAADIARIALTSQEPGAVGAIARFPHADVWAVEGLADELGERAVAAVQHREQCLRVERAARQLLALPNAPAAWAPAILERWASLWPSELSASPHLLGEGAPLRLGRRVVEGISVGGGVAGGGLWYEPVDRLLFGGDLLTLEPPPRVTHPTLHLESLGRAGRLSLAQLIPAHGLATTSPDLTLRSASLFMTNLRTNLQYVLNRPRSAWQLAEADLGYLPDDLMRFASLVLRYEVVLEEFEQAGVVVTEESPLGRLYRMGSPQASRGDALR